MTLTIKQTANRILARFGHKLISIDNKQYHHQWNAIPISEDPRTVIDVGCGYGTDELYNAFPSAYLMLVDPLSEYKSHMESILRTREGKSEIIALGEQSGDLTLNVDLDRPVLSSAFSRTPLTRREGHCFEQRQVPVKTMDELVAEHNLLPPFGIKIDTEGFELSVIKGAAKTLGKSVFVIVEASIQERFYGSYGLLELLNTMATYGFKVSNILEAPADGNGLVRFMDLLFTPESL
jgi:FkbM family methyltransferase